MVVIYRFEVRVLKRFFCKALVRVNFVMRDSCWTWSKEKVIIWTIQTNMNLYVFRAKFLIISLFSLFSWLVKSLRWSGLDNFFSAEIQLDPYEWGLCRVKPNFFPSFLFRLSISAFENPNKTRTWKRLFLSIKYHHHLQSRSNKVLFTIAVVQEETTSGTRVVEVVVTVAAAVVVQEEIHQHNHWTGQSVLLEFTRVEIYDR